MGEIKLFGQKIVLQVKEELIKIEQSGEEENEATKKRPNNIIPCPRCKSMETKFCYFNNYNLNQPRHFCKGCQRYWTAGGALRNVPIGAGRRKSKPPVHHGGGGLPENCLFDLNDMVVDEWQLAAGGGFGYDFLVKRRRRTESAGQTC